MKMEERGKRKNVDAAKVRRQTNVEKSNRIGRGRKKEDLMNVDEARIIYFLQNLFFAIFGQKRVKR